MTKQAGISQQVLDLIDQKLNMTFSKISDEKLIAKANKSLANKSGWPNRLECGFGFRGHNLCTLFNDQPYVAMPGGQIIKDLPSVKAFESRCDELNVKLDKWAGIGGVHYSTSTFSAVWPHIFMDLKVKNPEPVL